MRYLITISFFLLSQMIFSQHSITGIVVDQKDNAVGFAHVTNNSLNLGKVSSMNGKFELFARKGDTVTVSFVGFISETFAVESVHLVNYLKVKLSEDSLLLPSITIYSDPYFKVPFNYQGESMEIAGIEKSAKEPKGPGSLGGPSGNGVGMTLYGPITMFSKGAREQRKYSDAVESTGQTFYYDRYIEVDSVKNKLCKIYRINTSTYDRIIVSAHHRYPQIQTLRKPEEIWNWLLVYFDDVLN